MWDIILDVIKYIVVLIFVFMLGMVMANVTHSDTYKTNCTTINPVCEDHSATYIICPDSNYEVLCLGETQIKVKDTNIGGWE